MQNRVATPCIGLCSTTYGDSVCKGCKRFAHEIVDWNRYEDEQKAIVIGRLTQLMLNVVNRYLLVTDADLLKHMLDSHSLRYRKDQPAECWAFDMFRQTRGRFAHLSDLGLAKLPEVKSLSHAELWEAMNQEYLAVSEGHYERYFRQPLAFD
jgi:predicted Fe-S protein YdhL (DUF1289 family)